MRTLLVRQWFLLVLAGGGGLALWRPSWFAWTGRLDPRLVVAAALFLMAWTLPSRSLARTLIRPCPALWAVFVSYALLPALAWGVGGLLLLDFRIGLLLIVSVPCTLASAVLWTRRAGGDEAAALLVVLVTTASSWLITPAWLALTTGAVVAVDGPGMMLDLLLTLVLPVALGQGCRAVGALARGADRWKTGLSAVSQLLILVILLKAAANVGERLADGSAAPSALALLELACICAGVHLAGLACGLWGGRGLGFDPASRRAVAFACSQKTLPVAMLLFERHFQAAYPLAVLSLAFYHFGQLLLDTFIADALARRFIGSRTDESKPETSN